MKKRYKITIPEPCQENWDKMKPVAKGRFCDSCTKTVIDFTKMSSQQIQHFFEQQQNPENICGRFTNDQLDTITLEIPHAIIQQRHSFKKAFILALLIAMGTTLMNCTAHDNTQKTIAEVKVTEESAFEYHPFQPLIDRSKKEEYGPKDPKIGYDSIIESELFEAMKVETKKMKEKKEMEKIEKQIDSINKSYKKTRRNSCTATSERTMGAPRRIIIPDEKD